MRGAIGRAVAPKGCEPGDRSPCSELEILWRRRELVGARRGRPVRVVGGRRRTGIGRGRRQVLLKGGIQGRGFRNWGGRPKRVVGRRIVLPDLFAGLGRARASGWLAARRGRWFEQERR